MPGESIRGISLTASGAGAHTWGLLTEFEVGGSAVSPKTSPLFDREILADLVECARVEADGVAELFALEEVVPLFPETFGDLCERARGHISSRRKAKTPFPAPSGLTRRVSLVREGLQSGEGVGGVGLARLGFSRVCGTSELLGEGFHKERDIVKVAERVIGGRAGRPARAGGTAHQLLQRGSGSVREVERTLVVVLVRWPWSQGGCRAS